MISESSLKLPATFINGQQTDLISVYDRAFQYGDGLFETIAIHRGKPCLLARHLARLEKGLAVLAIPIPDMDLIARDIRSHSAECDNAVVKLTVTRGESQRGYRAPESPKINIIYSYSARENFQDNLEHRHAIDVGVCHTPVSINPALAGIKHLNRLEQVMARSEWSYDEYQEGLMCDIDGYVIEATSANVFLWKNNSLITPDLSRCGIEGIVRQLVIETAEQLNIACHIKKLTLEDCLNADAMFLTNSLTGISTVKRIENTTYDKNHSPVGLMQQVMNNVCS